MATIDWPERLLLRLSIGGHEAEGKVWTHARHNAAATARSGERADQIDLSWLSPAERAALRRQLNRLRASKAAQESSSSEAGESKARGLLWSNRRCRSCPDITRGRGALSS